MTNTFFIDLTITILGYLILALSFLGIGWMFSHILKIDFPYVHRFFSLTWLGWAAVLFLLQVLNLFFPINTYCSIPILLLGLLFAIRFFKTEVNTPIPPPSRTYFTLLVVAVLWIADLAMAATTLYDDGLYHFNTIRWLNESPIVLGLGNLHGRLAFNQSSFAYVAYLNFYPLFNNGYHLANSFLLILLLAEGLFYLSKYIDRSERLGEIFPANVVPIFFIFPLIYLALYSQLPSPTADNTASILEMLIFIHFVRLVGEKFNNANLTSEIIFIFILSAATITVKLSSLFYALTICLIVLLIHRKSLFLSGTSKRILFNISKLMAIPILIILVWSLRGILLSGCPAYPSILGCVHIPWAMPIEAVKSEADWIYSWARIPFGRPENVLSSWAWVRPWFYNLIDGNPFTVVYPVVVFLATLLTSLAFYRYQPISQKANKIWFAVLVPVLAGLAFWFFTAPDPRLASALFWILPVSAAVTLLGILANAGKLKPGLVILTILVMSGSVMLEIGFYPFMRGSVEGYMPSKTASLVERHTLSGFMVLVPAEGDQCWDSKLPCTPNFNENLNFIDRPYFPEFMLTAANDLVEQLFP